MSKYVALPYVVDQHCPSRPYPFTFSLPEDENERTDALVDMFRTQMCDDPDLDVVVSYVPNEFGDIQVANAGGSMFLYITQVED